jgi:hypothetical protein
VQLTPLVQLQATLLQCLQGIAPRQDTELHTRFGKVHTQPTTNGACADDGDFTEPDCAHARHP